MSDSESISALFGGPVGGVQAVPDQQYRSVVDVHGEPIEFGYPIPFPVPIASQIAGLVILMGYSVKETTGAASAEIDLFDGTDNRGILAIPVTLGSGQSTEDWFGTQGLWFRNGIFGSVISGSVAGSMFVAYPQR